MDTIILDEYGNVSPLAYGMHDEWSIGNIYSENRENMFDDFVKNKEEELRELYTRTFSRVVKNKEQEMVNWNELLVEESKVGFYVA